MARNDMRGQVKTCAGSMTLHRFCLPPGRISCISMKDMERLSEIYDRTVTAGDLN